MIKAVLFDYFGVVASDAYWENVKTLEAQQGRGERIAELSDEVNLGRISWDQYCLEIAADLGLSQHEVEERYSQHHLNRLVLGIARHLKEKGYQIALASNAHHEHLEPILEKTGLGTLFDRVYLSSLIGAAKPSAAFFTHIITDLGVPPDTCLLIDDSPQNVDGAERAGMNGYMYEGATDLSEYLLNL